MAGKPFGRKTIVLTVVSVLIAALGVTQVVAWQQTNDVEDFSLSESDLTAPGTAKPKPKPKKKVERSVADNGVTYRASAPAPAPVAPAPPTTAVQQASSSTVGAADKVALLVGINNAPGSTPLEGSITDVNNTKAALLKFGFKPENIQILTEGGANRGAILGALDSLANRSKDNGATVFLLATHSGQSGGDLSFATGGGGRISRHELASKLGRVKGKLVSILPTCYSAGYALPGIVGSNRIAIFSSSADNYTWQIGGAGSWLVLYMIDYGLLDGKSPSTSVEGLFNYAKSAISKENPDRTPIISDGIPGEFHLGPIIKPKTTVTASKPKPKPATSTPAPTTAPTAKPCTGFAALFGGCR